MDFNAWFQGFLQRALDFLPHLIVALIVFAVTLFTAGPAANWVARRAGKKITDQGTLQLLSILARWTVLITGTLVALDQVNFNITGFVAGLGIAGITVGFALQDITRNFIAGIILLIRKPFTIGDEVEIAGQVGSVYEINTRDTTLKSFDGDAVILPNINVFTATIINFTTLSDHRRTIRIRMPYEEDFEKATRVFLEAINNVEGVLNDPAATVLADELADAGITLVARFWVNREKNALPDVHSRVIKAIKESAEKEGIDLPYPIQLVKVERPAIGKE